MKVLIRNINSDSTKHNIYIIKDNSLIYKSRFSEQYPRLTKVQLLVGEEDIWTSRNKLLTRKEL